MRRTLALGVCISLIGCSAEKPVRPSDRSWMSGTVTVTPIQNNKELGVHVNGQWPDCGEGLWIRYELWLVQSGSSKVFLIGSAIRLATFQQSGSGVSGYSKAPDFVQRIDKTKPYRAVFDYEIWKGEPTKGELLAKNSVSSPEIGEH